MRTIGPLDNNPIDLLRFAQAAMNPRVEARTKAFVRNDISPIRFPTRFDLYDGVYCIAVVSVEDFQYDPMTACTHNVSQKVRRSVPIDDDYVHASIVIKVTYRQTSAG